MAAGVFNFTGPFAIKLNSDFTFVLAYTDSTTGLPVDLTGYNAKMAFGSSLPPAVTYLTLESTGPSPALTIAGSAGQITGYVAQAAVYTAFNTYLVDGQLNMDFDMLLYPSGGGVDGFLQGNALAVPGVTMP